MAMIRLGDKVKEYPITNVDWNGVKIRGPMTGTVVYIHPKWRYYTVRFDTAGGSFRESFRGGWRQYE